MSFVDLRPYFREVMRVVDPEAREWEDGFADDNIPNNILDLSWDLEILPASYNRAAHLCFHFDSPVKLKVFFKGFKEPKVAIDKALVYADSIVKAATKPSERLSKLNIKNVLPNLVDVQQLGQSNDNVIRLEITFDTNVVICSDKTDS